MKQWIILVGTIVVFTLSLACAHATPTPKKSTLTWDDYTDPKGTGFFLYWSQETPTPRTYDNSKRVDLGRPNPETVNVFTVLPTSSGSMCFKLTTYDALGRESGYSNEVCDWFGITDPLNLR